MSSTDVGSWDQVTVVDSGGTPRKPTRAEVQGPASGVLLRLVEYISVHLIHGNGSQDERGRLCLQKRMAGGRLGLPVTPK